MPRAKFSIPEDELIALWHSDQSNEAIARAFGVSTNTLMLLFRELRNAGKVPNQVRSTQRGRPRRSLNIGFYRNRGKPIGETYRLTVNTLGDDPLLARLKAAHPQLLARLKAVHGVPK